MSSAFIVATGKENEVSLTSEQIIASDDILHASVSNLEYEKLLHYNSKLSICFNAFATQAAYPPVEFIGQKHAVDASPAPSGDIFMEHVDFVATLRAVSVNSNDDCSSISMLFQEM